MANEQNNQKTPTMAEMQAEIARLQTLLAEKNNRAIVFKVAEEKGGISAIGVNNQFPVTLYATQWERLMEAALGTKLPADSPLGKFIAANGKYLAVKGEDETVANAKHALRVAEAHGVVSHPNPKNKPQTT